MKGLRNLQSVSSISWFRKVKGGNDLPRATLTLFPLVHFNELLSVVVVSLSLLGANGASPLRMASALVFGAACRESRALVGTAEGTKAVSELAIAVERTAGIKARTAAAIKLSRTMISLLMWRKDFLRAQSSHDILLNDKDDR